MSDDAVRPPVKVEVLSEKRIGGGWVEITGRVPDDVAREIAGNSELHISARPAEPKDSPDSGLIDWATRAVQTAPPEAFDAADSVKRAVAALELAGPDPAYSAGRVDFAEMLKTDAQWSLKHRFDELLGRPYLATQLAAMLPADVALRLVERAEAVIALRVNAQMDRLMNEITRTTENTIERLAQQAAEKRKELTRERFANPTRLD